LLKDLEPNLIAYLSSELYTEAKRIRRTEQPSLPGPGGQNQGQHPGAAQSATHFGHNSLRVRALAAQRREGHHANPPTSASSRPGQPLSVANLAATQTSGPGGSPRTRFLSVDSLTINIDNINPPKNMNTRDSESEDLSIPQQRTNFHQNAFFFNIQTFMKENKESLNNIVVQNLLKSNGEYQISSRGLVTAAPASTSSKQKSRGPPKAQVAQDTNIRQIYTNEELQQFCDELVFNQLMQKKPLSESEDSHGIDQISGIIDVAMTEILCGRANYQSKQVSPERQLVKLKGLSQLPNFRIGLIVKLI